MTVYASFIATALRLIAAKGELCQWREPAAVTVADPTKPWIETDSAAPATHNVRIAFFPIPKINSQLQRFMASKGGQPGGNVQGFMASVPFKPTVTGVVTRADGRVLAVRNLDPIEPDGTPIIWTIELQT